MIELTTDSKGLVEVKHKLGTVPDWATATAADSGDTVLVKKVTKDTVTLAFWDMDSNSWVTDANVALSRLTVGDDKRGVVDDHR